MSKAWIVVADSTRARIFSQDKPHAPLKELEGLVHPEGRLHEQELTSDLPGRSFDRYGKGRHSMEEDVGPKAQEAIEFANAISSHLDTSRIQGAFDKLVLIAAPSFLGLLRKHLNSETRKLVVHEIDKHLVQLDKTELLHHLPGRF